MIISISAFIIVIVLHEVAHGFTAYLLGDPTAKESGRLTLNPLAHMDPVGTVLIPGMLLLTNSPVVFGWAKPVPVNAMNFRDPKRGMFLTGLAGPASNFLIALAVSLIVKTGITAGSQFLRDFSLALILISLLLGIFNLIPVPPLDGSNLIVPLLPEKAYYYFMRMERYGFIILIALLYLGLLDRVILPLTLSIARFLLS